VVDLFEEARGIELDERLVTNRRGIHAPSDLLRAATAAGHRSLGWSEAGRIASGAPADFVTVRLDSSRMAGTTPHSVLASLVFAAGAADVSDVVVGGRRIVEAGQHLLVEDPARAMSEALAGLVDGKVLG
jgi:cytosine/adenosine deaminase-related metal-dependent hydrolase